jgi:uncharacterized protein (DUF111 family)
MSEHGEIPVPAPATLGLLSGYRVKFSDRPEELATPTGAAIIASMFRNLPQDAVITPDRIGYGAGTREGKSVPNVLRAILGSLEHAAPQVCIITSTIDDMNPESYGYIMEKLFDHGALEVYYNPVMMKKNRPGLEITIITEEVDVHRLSDFLFSNSTTLGVRINREERIELPRRRSSVDTSYGAVEVKIAQRPGGIETVSPEYESCRAAADKANVSLLDIYEAARRAWHEKNRK